MKVNLTYPKPSRQSLLQKKLIALLRWPFLFAAFLCPVLNLVIGGKAWSVVVVWSLFTLWSTAVAPDLVEYNRISQVIKLVVCASILMLLIDRLLSPGWAVEVVPIVCSSGLMAAGVLFFTDMERQKQNMLPLLLLIFVSLLSSAVGLFIWREESRWALATLGALAFMLLVCCACTLGPDFVRELKKRFHMR